MARRDFDPNFTMFPNVLLDKLMGPLSPTEWTVLCYIVRRTYGFDEDRAVIPFSQMESGKKGKDGRMLDRGTGIGRTALGKAVYALERVGILKAEGKNTQAKTYCLNLDADIDKVTDAELARYRSDFDARMTSNQPRLGMELPSPVRPERPAQPAPPRAEQRQKTSDIQRRALAHEMVPPKTVREKKLAGLLRDVAMLQRGTIAISLDSVSRRSGVDPDLLLRMVAGEVTPELAHIPEQQTHEAHA